MGERLMSDTGAPADGVEPSAALHPRDITKMPLLIVTGMFAAGALLYPYLPSPIPMHWGVTGLPDAFSPKTALTVFLQPLIALALYGLLLIAPALDSKRRNLRLSIGAYDLIVDAIVGLQAVIYSAVFSITIGFTLQAVGQKNAKASDAAIILSLEAVFGALFGYILLHETLSGQQIAGCALMLTAMILSQITGGLPEGETPPVSVEIGTGS